MNNEALIVAGPTASGKTDLSLELAARVPAEIVSADSRQIFRFMDIGTAKPTRQERERAVHHCIDILNPDEYFSAGQYSRAGRDIVGRILAQKKLPIIAGGSGLYIKALVDGVFSGPVRDRKIRERLTKTAELHGTDHLYRLLQDADPQSAAKIHPHDARRIIRALEVFELAGMPISSLQRERTVPASFKPVYVGLHWSRDELYRRINLRVEQMMSAGLTDEVAAILERGYSEDLNSLNSVGYREIIAFLRGEIPKKTAEELIKRNTRRYAKRQLTWLRSLPDVDWYECAGSPDWGGIAEKILRKYNFSGS